MTHPSTGQGQTISTTFRVGVVGTGGIARQHLDTLTRNPLVRLCAVADTSAATARYAAERWGAASWFTSHTELLERCRPDVVHVLTPPASHRRIVLDCLAAGSHVVCEKPLATSLEDFHELQDAATRADRWLLEDQNYRWNDTVLELMGLVRSGSLGRPLDVEVRMALRLRDGGQFADRHVRSPAHDLPAGPISDLLPHLVYLGQALLPGAAAPDDVRVRWDNIGGDDGLWQRDTLDATLITGPARLRLHFSSWTMPEALSLVVRGDVGEAATDVFQPSLVVRVPRKVGSQLTPTANHLLAGASTTRSGARNFRDKLLQKTTYHGMHRFLDLVYEALAAGEPPPLSYEQMEATARGVDLLLRPENQWSA